MMEQILVENFHNFRTGEIVGQLFLTKKATKIVTKRLEHLPLDKIPEIVLNYYEPVFVRGEFIKVAFSDEEIRATPDTYNLEPTRDAVDQYGFALPVIELGSILYDDIFTAKGVGFEKVEPK